MDKSLNQRNGHRKDFSRITTSLPIPNLIDVQRRSYERFLQMNLLPEERVNQGLQSVFTSIFPFSDFRETCSLDFVKYATAVPRQAFYRAVLDKAAAEPGAEMVALGITAPLDQAAPFLGGFIVEGQAPDDKAVKRVDSPAGVLTPRPPCSAGPSGRARR